MVKIRALNNDQLWKNVSLVMTAAINRKEKLKAPAYFKINTEITGN